MKSLFILLVALFTQSASAATVTGKLQNQGQSWICVAKSASDVNGSNCANAPYVVMTCSSGTAWGGFTCDGRIRFHNSNLCAQAGGSTTVQLAYCDGSARQNWWFAYGGLQSRSNPGRYVTLSGSNIVLTGLAASRVLTGGQAWWLR